MLILFILFATVAVISALSVILQRNPIYSAIGLIATLCSLAGLFLTLSAQFIAAIQIVVYAGAIMVLFVFVIMLLNVRAEEARLDRQKFLKYLAAPLFLALLAEVYYVIRTVADPPVALPATGTAPPELILGTVESIGSAMFTSYLLPFEATSVLILMAIVGAMHLARRERGGSCGRRKTVTIPLSWYLALSAVIFSIGVVGVIIQRNVIVLFMCIELMLNAVNLTFVAFSRYLGNSAGQLFVFIVMAVAAAEAAVGLAIIISLFRNRETLNVDEADLLKL